MYELCFLGPDEQFVALSVSMDAASVFHDKFGPSGIRRIHGLSGEQVETLVRGSYSDDPSERLRHTYNETTIQLAYLSGERPDWIWKVA